MIGRISRGCTVINRIFQGGTVADLFEGDIVTDHIFRGCIVIDRFFRGGTVLDPFSDGVLEYGIFSERG